MVGLYSPPPQHTYPVPVEWQPLPDVKPATFEERVKARASDFKDIDNRWTRPVISFHEDPASQHCIELTDVHKRLWKAQSEQEAARVRRDRRNSGKLRRALARAVDFRAWTGAGTPKHSTASDADVAATKAHAKFAAVQQKVHNAFTDHDNRRKRIEEVNTAWVYLDAVFEWIFDGLADRPETELNAANAVKDCKDTVEEATARLRTAESLEKSLIAAKTALTLPTQRLANLIDDAKYASLKFTKEEMEAFHTNETQDGVLPLEERDMIAVVRAFWDADKAMAEARCLNEDIADKPICRFIADAPEKQVFLKMIADPAFRSDVQNARTEMEHLAVKLEFDLVTDATWKRKAIEETLEGSQRQLETSQICLRNLRNELIRREMKPSNP